MNVLIRNGLEYQRYVKVMTDHGLVISQPPFGLIGNMILEVPDNIVQEMQLKCVGPSE